MHDEQIQPSDNLSPAFQSIVEHLPVVVYVDSDDRPVSRTLYVSPNVETILGHPPSAFVELGDDWVSMLHPDDVEPVTEQLVQGGARGEPFQMVYRYVRPDGSVVWVRDQATPYVEATTGRRVWQGVIEDITAQVAAERDRDSTELRYETLLGNLPAVVYEMDPDDDRRTRYVNRKIEELLGYTMEEWLDQPDMWTEVLHPDDREVELAAHDLASSTGDPWQREYRLIRADGQIVWVRDQAELLHDIDGHPTRWQGVMVDITPEKTAQLALAAAHGELEFRVRARTAALQETNELMGIEIAERQRAEEERERAEQKLGHILENVPAVVYLWQMRESDDGTYSLFITAKIAEMLGFSPAEWAEGGWRDRLHPHDRERVNEAAQRSIDEGVPFQMEYRYLDRDGRVVWVVDNAVLQSRNARGEPLMFEGVMMNVTALHEAQQKAAEAEDRFQTLVERGPAVQYSYVLQSWDPPKVAIEYVSPQLSELLGLSIDEWIASPMAWFHTIHPDDREGMLEASRYTWRTGEPWVSEYRILAADGRVVWLADRGHCVERDEDGHPMRFLGAIADITERRERLDALEAELATLRALTDGAPAVTWTEHFDHRTGMGRYAYISPEAAEIVGLSPEQLIAELEHFPRLVHLEDRARVNATNLAAESTGLWVDTYRIVRSDGAIRWLHGRARRVDSPDPDVSVWHGLTIDVTTQVEAALAAGLTHEAWATPPHS
jgi:PAS domain S-box-containing protein